MSVATKVQQGINETIFDLSTALNVLSQDQEIAFDLETGGLSPWSDPIAVVTMRGRTSQRTAILHVRGAFPESLRKFLSEPNRLYIGHNAACFDMLFLANNGVDVFASEYYDTLIGEQVVLTSGRRDVRSNLKAAIARRLGIELAKGQGDSSWMNPTLTYEQIKYCYEDVLYLSRLRDEQLKKVKGTSQENALDFEQMLVPIIVQMELNGLPVDWEMLQSWRKEKEIEIAHAYDIIDSIFGLPRVNANSAPQLIAAYKRVFDLDIYNTDKNTLAELALGENDIGKVTKAIQAARRGRKRSGMYDDAWIGDHIVDGFVHARFWTTSTDTARMSSSNPNLQQIPVDGRKIIGGLPGYKILSTDYCLHPDTLLDTPDGRKKICDMKQGDMVYSLRGGKIVTNKVVRVTERAPLPAYRITLDNDKTVIASVDHKWPVRVENSRDICYRKTEDLFVGCRMVPIKRILNKPYNYIHMYTFTAYEYTKEHALVANAYYGPCPEGMEIHHIDENKLNNNKSNLCYISQSIHRKKGIEHRRSYAGKGNPSYGKGVGEIRKCQNCDKKFYIEDKTVVQPFCRTCRKVGLNHKVKSIEFIGLQPMWTIEVENDHNYALDAGVFTCNSQLEIRIAAAYAHDAAMIKALASEDIHKTVASNIYQIPIESVTPSQRKLAKAATFTLLFAGSAGGLVRYAKIQGSRLKEEEAKDIVNKFFTTYKGLARTRSTAYMLSNKKFHMVTLPNGFVRQILPNEGYLSPAQIINTQVQGTAAVGLKRALMLAEQKGLMDFIGAAVHDEIVAVVPNDIVYDVKRILETCMIEGMSEIVQNCPIGVESKINTHWGMEDESKQQ